jgi:DNA-binding response OmpR family regulator
MEKIRITIIEDEQDVSVLATKRLRAIGYEVTCFFKGEEVLEKIRFLRADLILLDLWLPDVSGIEVFKKLRSEPATREIPVVFFSANPLQEKFCLNELHADGFIKKPYEAGELLKIIKEISERKFHKSASQP